MGLTKKLNKVEDLVINHLKKHEICRDNTKFLYFSVLQEFYKVSLSDRRQDLLFITEIVCRNQNFGLTKTMISR